jgi:hypothetical protein
LLVNSKQPQARSLAWVLFYDCCDASRQKLLQVDLLIATELIEPSMYRTDFPSIFGI